MPPKERTTRKRSAPSNTTAVIYARVSSKEQEEEGYSVPAQLRLLREYANKQGITVRREFVEAETAKKAGRKSFEAMLRFCREESVQAVLVEKTDRLYRNFADYVKVEELGLDLHFVKENQRITGESHSSERLMHSIKVALAKNYVDNLSEEIRKGMREKALQGVYPSHAPIGYLNAVVNGRKTIVPDPERAPLVRKVFEAYALGQISVDSAAKFAKQIGLLTKKGKRVHKSSVALMLGNDVYVGRVKWAGESYEGSHEPIVERDLFERVQAIMGGRTSRKGYGDAPIAYRV